MRCQLLLLVVALGAACEESSGPDPVAATITIAAVTDTLSWSVRETVLTAEVKDADGQLLDDKQVTWTSTDADLEVIPGEDNTATLRWLSGMGFRDATISATVDDVSGQLQVSSCPVRFVSPKNSSTMLLGRSAVLAATGWVEAAFGEKAQLAQGEGIVWATSNPSVVSVENGTATALAIGSAVLTATGCEASESVTVSVVSSGYTVNTLAELGSLVSGPAYLSDSGHVATRVPGASPENRLWSSTGSVIDLGDCEPRDVNDFGQVLCHSPTPAPQVWDDGVVTALDTLTLAPFAVKRMSDSGHVALMPDRGAWLAARWRDGTLDTLPLPQFSGGPSVAGINNLGDVIGYATPSGSGQLPVIWSGGQMTYIGRFGRTAAVSAVNDSGDVALGGEFRTGLVQGSIGFIAKRSTNWAAEALRPHPTVFNDVATEALDINNAGQVIGSGSQGHFVWHDGNLALLGQLLADPAWTVEGAIRINDRGEILATAIKDAIRYLVLLTPPA